MLLDGEGSLRIERVLFEDLHEVFALAMELETLGFQKAELEAPCGVAREEPRLLCCGFSTGEVELAAQKFAADLLEDGGWIVRWFGAAACEQEKAQQRGC